MKATRAKTGGSWDNCHAHDSRVTYLVFMIAMPKSVRVTYLAFPVTNMFIIPSNITRLRWVGVHSHMFIAFIIFFFFFMTAAWEERGFDSPEAGWSGFVRPSTGDRAQTAVSDGSRWRCLSQLKLWFIYVRLLLFQLLLFYCCCCFIFFILFCFFIRNFANLSCI